VLFQIAGIMDDPGDFDHVATAAVEKKVPWIFHSRAAGSSAAE
jgi:hypothetical protein